MTDVTPGNSPNPEAAPEGLQIGIGAQYIKDLSFESPSAPQVFAPSSVAPEINAGFNVHTRIIAEQTFEVVLSIKIEAKIEKKTAYITELAYAGVFVMPPMGQEELKMFLLIEAPRLLFPYARAIISNTTRDGGFAPMMLNPVDFMALYRANQDKLGTMATAGAA